MSKIVISYRRSDSQDIAMRVRDVMALHFGKNSVFTDIDSIPLGVDFLEYIERQLSACDALIAIVGPHWVDAGKGRGQGVHLETDFVRIEVESALKRKIPVIPALVAGALMPRPDELPDALHQFAFRNATAIDSGLNFRNDVARLIRSLDATFAASKMQKKTQITSGSTEKPQDQFTGREYRFFGEVRAEIPEETLGEWTARLVAREPTYLLIELFRLDERHRLEYDRGAFWGNMKLDGVLIQRYWSGGRKTKDIQIGGSIFRLKFNLAQEIDRVELILEPKDKGQSIDRLQRFRAFVALLGLVACFLLAYFLLVR